MSSPKYEITAAEATAGSAFGVWGLVNGRLGPGFTGDVCVEVADGCEPAALLPVAETGLDEFAVLAGDAVG